MKVKALHPVWGDYRLKPGEIGEMDDKTAKALKKSGAVEIVEEDAEKKPEETTEEEVAKKPAEKKSASKKK